MTVTLVAYRGKINTSLVSTVTPVGAEIDAAQVSAAGLVTG